MPGGAANGPHAPPPLHTPGVNMTEETELQGLSEALSYPAIEWF